MIPKECKRLAEVDFPIAEVFENITSAIPENESVLITLKEGAGDLTDSDGRIFYLWQDQEAQEMLDTLGFKVCDFSTSASITGSDDF